MRLTEAEERDLAELRGTRDGGTRGVVVGGVVAALAEFVRLGPFPLAPPRMLYAVPNRRQRRADLARKRAR